VENRAACSGREVIALNRIRHDLDLAWKEALTSFLPQFLQLFLPHVHEDIDWTHTPEFLESELRSLHRGLRGRRQHADLVVRVRLRAGGPALVVLHFEVQSQRDEDLPLRMRIYNSRLFDRHRCPVYSLLILGDSSPVWRPSRYQSRIWDCCVTLDFPVLKVLDWKPRRAELEALGNPFALVVATHLAVLETRPDQSARLHRALRLCRLMATHGFTVDQVYGLFKILEAMMAMTDELYQDFEAGVALLEEELDVTLITRSELKGIKKGREEGRRRSIVDVAEARFGAPALELEAALDRVSSPDALKRLTRLAATAASLEELLEAVQAESAG
jgi:hypothetical protein